MSDTNNQEDLSVEDILSSIKDILVDEEGEVKENKPEEDVLNLDNSMIVDNAVSSKNAETLLDSITEPVTQEEEKSTFNDEPSIADSIDVEKTLDVADKIDFNDLSSLSGLIDEEKTAAIESGVDQETIDASASIINNFAKVFAEKQHIQQSSASSEIDKELSGNIEQIGIGNMVKETIIAEVKSGINAHFEEIASKIIAEQTQQWLNKNLASIVEKTVSKEIERVIAKVGS